MIQIDFHAGSSTTPVIIGNSAVQTLADQIPSHARRVAVVTQHSISQTPTFHKTIEALRVDRTVSIFTLEDGETVKNLSTIEELCGNFAAAGLNRNDIVVTIGGGVVSDTGGFAASVFHRGIEVIHVPTTLLGQVDAALGGKTGVNLRSGKNLVGTFWQPSSVICDLDWLASLPVRELQSGLGEMAKYHFIASTVGLQPPAATTKPNEQDIARCVAIESAFVGADEREGGVRALLNYGHTLAHALEIEGDFDLRHGEAVAIGIAFAAQLAHHLNRIAQSRVDEHRNILDAHGLTWTPPKNLSPEALVALMSRDKKSLGDSRGLTFVLDGDNGPEVVRNISPVTVCEVLNEFQS